jgi:hypothetical protein
VVGGLDMIAADIQDFLESKNLRGITLYFKRRYCKKPWGYDLMNAILESSRQMEER